MATTTHLTNAYLSIGATDFTDQTQSVTLTVGYDSLETTAFGDTGHKYTKGLQTLEVRATLYTSYGTGELEAKLEDIVGDGNTTVVVGCNGSVTPSATNPVYTLTNAMLASFTPVMGGYGELVTVDVVFTGGTYAVARS